MISHGTSHALAVLASNLAANFVYQMVLLQFPDMENPIAQNVLPVLKDLNLSLSAHTVGLLGTAMIIGFVSGMVFRFMRRA